MVRPAVVIPIHDPKGIYFPHLERITPLLKTIFSQAIINVPPSTRLAQPGIITRLTADPFYLLSEAYSESPVGDHFRALYAYAARACPPEQMLHLCYIDRLAFTLETSYRQSFIADVQAVTPEQTPLIFQRSTVAWDTHPANYRDIESMITRAGEWLFHKTLDFAWCHLAVQAGLLAEILPRTRLPDLSMVTEIILEMLPQVKTKDVDWLAWEDPFILGCDPQELKAARENDPSEARKRLAYSLQSMQLIYQHST